MNKLELAKLHGEEMEKGIYYYEGELHIDANAVMEHLGLPNSRMGLEEVKKRITLAAQKANREIEFREVKLTN